MESYADYETPANLRKRQPRAVGDDLRADATGESYLDIPAFLRRQAD
jgi:hypothetical protein